MKSRNGSLNCILTRLEISYKTENMKKKGGLGVFEKYLTLWVAACIIAGITIGKYIPTFPAALASWSMLVYHYP